MSLQTGSRREAENTLEPLAVPDFGTPRRTAKGSFDFLCPLPTPCPGTGSFHFRGMGGMALVGGSTPPTPQPAHSHHAHCPAHLPTQRSAQGCSPKWPATLVRDRVHAVSLWLLLPHRATTWLLSCCSTVMPLLTLGSFFMPRLSPWDQEHFQGHQISKQAAKIHPGKNCLLKGKFFMLR